jgi:hypothetical protein
MDFFGETDVRQWTCKNVIKHYKEKNVEYDLKQILDTVNKDIKRVAGSNKDPSRREKAQSIINKWKVC